jgi:ferredoxin
MITNGSICTSQCGSCSSVCEGGRITNIATLLPYTVKRCEVILGDLIIADNVGLNSYDIQDAFLSLTAIIGDLVITNAASLTDLFGFQSLRHVSNIHLLNNANLVDARLPALECVGDVSVQSCPRLCPAHYPSLSTVPETNDCVNTSATQYLIVDTIQPDVTIDDVILEFEAKQESWWNDIGCGSKVRH